MVDVAQWLCKAKGNVCELGGLSDDADWTLADGNRSVATAELSPEPRVLTSARLADF